VRLVDAWVRLDRHTPRADFLGLTPEELDKIAPRADAHVRRARFYEDVCSASRARVLRTPRLVLDAWPNAKRSGARSSATDWSPGSEAEARSRPSKRKEFREHHTRASP